MGKNFNKEKFIEIEKGNGSAVLFLKGDVNIRNANNYDSSLDPENDLQDISELIVDLSRAGDYDSFLVVFLSGLKTFCNQNNIQYKTGGVQKKMQGFLDILEPKTIITEEASSIAPNFSFFFIRVGEKTIKVLKDSKRFIEFFGEIIIKYFNLLIHPGDMRWKDFPFHFLRAGVSALPIVLLIVFLIGVITGYQGALQLKQFGADIYIADLIGISITRELGPLMTAILVAGRSGSAFAAEIGTMKVSEEIDALQSMGFDHTKFLVLPRVTAVVIAMPLLTILADFAGIGGGLLSAISTLDITISGYINELQRALNFAHIFSGIGKSAIFGFLIATVGCFQGMQVHGGAESVGKYTTASVVSGVFLIIISDAIFTFIFQVLGI